MYHLPLMEKNTEVFWGGEQPSWPGCRPRLTGRSAPRLPATEQADELSGLEVQLFPGPQVTESQAECERPASSDLALPLQAPVTSMNSHEPSGLIPVWTVGGWAQGSSWDLQL